MHSAGAWDSASLVSMAHEHTDVHHVERHFASGNLVRDIVIGMADGLTVPFALAAGLTGAVSVTRLIVLAGSAEIAAGSIAMGLGGYLAAKGDASHYESEREREECAAHLSRIDSDVPEFRQTLSRQQAQSLALTLQRRLLDVPKPLKRRCLRARFRNHPEPGKGHHNRPQCRHRRDRH